MFQLNKYKLNSTVMARVLEVESQVEETIQENQIWKGSIYQNIGDD